jgi:predicted ATPase/class 3 adenylate cyclase
MMGTMPERPAERRPTMHVRGISRREVDVLEAVGERLTNAEIAARLYLSERTIESHVSSLLRKLGVANRRELATAAADLVDRSSAVEVTVRPTGTVTFVFTDIVGSTELWDRYPADMPETVERHDNIVRRVIDEHGGHVFSTGGDGFGGVFARAGDALVAAAAVEVAVLAEPWAASTPIRVRIGVHTGEAHERGGDFFGSAVNRAARIMGVAAPFQVLVSSTTAALVADIAAVPELVDVGEHALRGLRQRQRLFELMYAGRPPIAAPVPDLVGTLAAPVVRLVGRGPDQEHVAELLDEHRLVTLVGAGGIGKTSLAEAVASQLAPSFKGGTWFVGLSALARREVVAPTFAAAVGVQPRRDVSITESIVASYRDQHALLVVDNCEHVIDDACRVVEAILRGCPNVKVLATAREPLAIHGERRVDLRSLTVPDEADTPTEIMSTPSAELLIQRAAEAGRRLTVDAGGARTVGALCRVLGGIPLAIELAASQLRMLSPAEVLHRLEAGLGTLTDDRRDAPSRHQTLQATMDWSYQLLGPDERRVFDRLSVFFGGFTVEAAQAVCGGEGLDPTVIVELVWRLMDRSMVQVVDDDDDTTRYILLEPLRQHAFGHLDATERSRLAGRHLVYYRDLAETSVHGIRGPDEAAWVARLNADFQNLRVAVRHGVSTGRLDDAARLVAALHDYAIWRQRFEVGDWARAVLELTGAEQHSSACVLYATAGWGRCIAGDFDAATAYAEQGLLAEHRTRQQCGWLHDVLGHVQFFQANNDAGLEPSHAEIDRARASSDRYRLAYVLADNAMHEYLAGNATIARARADEALLLADAQQCPSLVGIAHAARSMTQLDVDPDEARSSARKAARAAGAVEAGWTKNVVTVWLILLAVDHADRIQDLELARDAIESYRRAGDEVRVRTVVNNCLPVLLRILPAAATVELAELHGACLDRPRMKAALFDAYVEPAIAEIEARLGPAFAEAVQRGRELTTSDAAELTISLLQQALTPHSGHPQSQHASTASVTTNRP